MSRTNQIDDIEDYVREKLPSMRTRRNDKNEFLFLASQRDQVTKILTDRFAVKKRKLNS